MRVFILFILLLFLSFFPVGCSTEQPPDSENTPDKPVLSLSRDNTFDQSDSTLVAAKFIDSLQTADIETLKLICNFSSKELTPEVVLNKYGNKLSKLNKDELIITEADLGPDVNGVFFAGLKDDSGYILLAFKLEMSDQKYYVVIVTDDPAYEF